MKTLARILGGFALITLGGTAALFLLQPRIPLGPLSGTVSSLLTLLTGSEQVISGRYFLVPGAWTTLTIEDGAMLLTGRKGFRLKAEIASAQATVQLWSLASKEINLNGIAVHGMKLDVYAGEKEEAGETGKKENDSSRTEFLPFTLKQTGNIDLADISASIVTKAKEPRISFLLEKGKGGFGYETPLQFTLEAMLDNRKFGLDVQGGTTADLAALNTNWPITIHMHYKSVAAELAGYVAKGRAEHTLTADFSLTGEHFDDLVSIIGLQGSKNQPFALQGIMLLSKEEIRGDFSRVQVGNEILTLSASVNNYFSSKPHYTIEIQDDLLDLDKVKGFFIQEGEMDAKTAGKIESAWITRDDILLPGSFPLRNLTLELDLGELFMAGRKAKSIHLHAVMVDGEINESPFAVTFENAALSGHFSLRTVKGMPQIAVHYSASSFDIGTFLKDLQLADGIDMYIEKTETDIKTRGRTLGELFDNFTFTFSARDGKYVYQDPNTGATLPVFLDSTRIIGEPGEKITATIHGTINDSPVSVVMEFDDRRDEPPGSVKDVPVILNIRIAETQWKLTGKIPLPFRKEGTVLHSRLAGESLSSLNGLLNLQLPDLGPYELGGELSIVPQGYRLDGIQIQVGSSLLKGYIAIDTKADPPEVDIGLEAQRIQLDDFKALRLMSRPDPESARQAAKEETENTGREKMESRLTDQAVLDSYNALIHIKIKEVISGADHLGSGTLEIEQLQGRLRIAPLEIRLPDGKVSIDFSMSPSGRDRLYTLHMRIEELDYGFVARRFDPDTDMSGIINLRASVESVSPDRQSIMANGSGYLDFCIQPRQLRAGVIDLWAVNLLSYLVPILAPKEGSTINCAAGRFNLSNGILSQDDFLIDTSQIRVIGVVEVDFNKGIINATLRPIPKRPQFYSLSTPIRIQGALSDLHAGIAPGGLAGTVIRLATSFIVVPLQWIIQNKLPIDGTEDCIQLMEERTE